MSLQIIDPTNFPAWDDLLLNTPGHSFFHSSAWARVLKESYGYTPMYFASIEKGHFSALVPIMEVNSFITGKRGVSLPFTDYCEPIIDKDQDFADLFNILIEHGKKRGWKYIELRGGDKYLVPRPSSLVSVSQSSALTPVSSSLNPASSRSALCALRSAPFPSEKYLGHTLDLTKGEKALYSGLRDSTRRNIKKAIKEGVAVKILNSPESVREFYRLNCMTRKQHGLPPQPYYFFKNIYEHIVSHNKGFVSLASYQDLNIAGTIFFYFGENALFKYGASNKKYQYLRANNFVTWEGIKWSSQNGYKRFCFGRTELENKGLQQFKAGWGTEERTIHYFKHDLTRGLFVSKNKNPERGAQNHFFNRLAQRMPIPVLNLAGSVLYRHIG